MAMDMYMVLENISGESKDKIYGPKKAIDVLAWSWGMSQSGSFHSGGGGGAGKVNVQDLSFTKWVDNSSPTLMQHIATGKHIAKGTLIVRKAGGTPLEYIKIKLNDVMVASLTTGGSGGEDRLTENVTLNFAEVEFDYVPQKSDGSGGTEVEFKYNIAENDAQK